MTRTGERHHAARAAAHWLYDANGWKWWSRAEFESVAAGQSAVLLARRI
jgi:hypothetical protein